MSKIGTTDNTITLNYLPQNLVINSTSSPASAPFDNLTQLNVSVNGTEIVSMASNPTIETAFSVNNQGFIVNMDNIPILDKNQNTIKLPFNVSVDGKTPQKLTNVKVEPDGKIKASYGTSEFLTIGQVGLAKFSNEAGLRSIGESNFLQTTESGIPTIGNPKDLGFGSIQNGSLENSNTEISDELVKLIRAQQAFNGNAKMLETERKATELLMR